MKKVRILSIIVVIGLSMGAWGGLKLVSVYGDRDIRIDGKLSDWRGVAFVKKADLSLGLANDDTHLYVAVVASDKAVRRQIMMSGLYLWFDEGGGKNKNFGVCFPIGGLDAGDPGAGAQGSEGGPEARRPTPPEGPDSLRSPLAPGSARRMRPPAVGADSAAARFPTAPRQVMVYSPKSESWEIGQKGSLGGVDVAADIGTRALVLELRIPLERDPATGYGVGARAGATIGIGIESPEISVADRERADRPARGAFGGPGGGEGSGPPGGMGGGRRGSGGTGGPGARDGDRMERPEPIRIWGKLTLEGS